MRVFLLLSSLHAPGSPSGSPQAAPDLSPAKLPDSGFATYENKSFPNNNLPKHVIPAKAGISLR